jgi:hypothetical protein
MKVPPVFGILMSLLAPTVACADTFAGVVKDSSGRPVSGTSVFVQWEGGLPEPRFDAVQARTNARGAFHATATCPPCRFNGITLPFQEPHRWTVTALVPGYAVSTVRVQDSARNIAITLAPETRLPVHIQDGEGHPVPGAHLDVKGLSAGPWMHCFFARPTDASGNTTITNLPRKSELSLRVDGPDWVSFPDVKKIPAATLADAADSPPLTIVVQKTAKVGVVLHGRIVTEDGKPVIGCTLMVQTPSYWGTEAVYATSGAYGSFRFPPLPYADVEVIGPVPDGYALQRDYVLRLPTSEPVEAWIVTAYRGMTITGRVLDDATSQPIANAAVQGADEMHDTLLPIAATGPDGRFQVHVIAWRWSLLINAVRSGRTYAWSPLGSIDGHNGETKDLGDIRLKPVPN